MSMTVTEGLYSQYAAQNASDRTKKQEAGAAARETKKSGEARQPQLSTAAKKLLEKLQKTHGNMDIMVYGEGQNAKDLLSRGTKEFSVLFSSEELEKMAADKKCEDEYMNRVQGALRMSEEINKKFGFTSASGDTQINKVAIAFNKDGTMSYFAELEKTSEQQRARIEKSREERTGAKKAAERKKTVVEASSEWELIQKMKTIDWSKIREEKETQGSRFDFSI